MEAELAFLGLVPQRGHCQVCQDPEAGWCAQHRAEGEMDLESFFYLFLYSIFSGHTLCWPWPHSQIKEKHHRLIVFIVWRNLIINTKASIRTYIPWWWEKGDSPELNICRSNISLMPWIWLCLKLVSKAKFSFFQGRLSKKNNGICIMVRLTV